MSAMPRGAVPPSRLQYPTEPSWSSSEGSPYNYPETPSPSLLPMSPESLHSYMSNCHEETMPTQNLGCTPTTGWYGQSVPAPNQTQPGFYTYGYEQPYATPHSSSTGFSQPFPTTANGPDLAKTEPPTTFSPGMHHSRLSEARETGCDGPTNAQYLNPARGPNEHSPHFPPHIKTETNPLPTRPHSCPSSSTPNPTLGSVDYNWNMNPLGISTSLPEPYYPGSTYSSVGSISPQWSQSSGHSTDIYAPQPRGMYAHIAPHPFGPQRTSVTKRSQEDVEASDHSKRRKRSDAASVPQMELQVEERLLIQLREEECVPWKDVAAKFESELGKVKNIPALQMQWKRLKERRRVWTPRDVEVLRKAHEDWERNRWDAVSNKVSEPFLYISKKMLELGAAEQWNPKQCENKWNEINRELAPFRAYDGHAVPSYAPYTMSPVETPTFLPYRPVL